MEPKTVFLAAAASAVLVGGGVLASLVFFASEEGGLGSGSRDLPAAADVMETGLDVATDGDSPERFQMLVSILGEDGASLGTMDIRADPDTRDASVHFALDLAALQALSGEGEMEGFDAMGAQLLSDLTVASVDGVVVFGIGGENYGMRDFVPNTDEEGIFSFFPSADEAGGSEAFTADAFLSEMTAFGAEEGNEVEYEIRSSTWQGKKAYIIDATFSNATSSGEGTFTFAQADYRPLHFDIIATEEGHTVRMVAAFTYGEGVEITLPDAFTRWPVDPNTDPTVSPALYDATVADSFQAEVPLETLELRVVRASLGYDPFSGGPTVEEIYASWKPTQPSGTVNGFHFSFEDAEPLALLSAGDSYTVESDGTLEFGDEGNVTYTVMVWDEWAEAYEGQMTPAPGIVWLLAAIGAALLAARKRKDP